MNKKERNKKERLQNLIGETIGLSGTFTFTFPDENPSTANKQFVVDNGIITGPRNDINKYLQTENYNNNFYLIFYPLKLQILAARRKKAEELKRQLGKNLQIHDIKIELEQAAGRKKIIIIIDEKGDIKYSEKGIDKFFMKNSRQNGKKIDEAFENFKQYNNLQAEKKEIMDILNPLIENVKKAYKIYEGKDGELTELQKEIKIDDITWKFDSTGNLLINNTAFKDDSRRSGKTN